MESFTHFVLVGHTKETILGSLLRFPVNKVVLVLGVNAHLEGERRARVTASEVRRALRNVVFEELFIDLDDVVVAAPDLIGRIKSERDGGSKVLINLSGGLRSAGLAAYLAAEATGTQAYIGLPDYRDGKIVGVRAVNDVPLMPLKEFSAGKKEILLKLLEKERFAGELLGKGGKTGASKSKLSYHLKDLKKEGLIETSREGRNLKIKLSFAGKLYALGLE